MNDQNRYEDVPQKENKFLKGLKAFGSYWKFVFVDFFNSFKYNNMKLASIIFALPGILLGFFMFAHVPTIRHVTVSYSRSVDGSQVVITPELNADTADDTSDYKLTLGSYGGSSNIVLVKDGYDKTAADFDQNITPIDGYAADSSKTTQLTTPTATLTELAKDQYSISVSGTTDEEAPYVKYYSVFIYQTVNIGTDSAKNEQDYYLTYTTYAIGNTTLTISRLKAGTPYKVSVKAIPANDSIYYASCLSDKASFTVATNGSGASSQDYDAANTSYIQYSGNYSVSTVGGAAPSGDIADLKVVLNPNGTISYTYQGNTTDARLTTAGNNLNSNAIETINILPFDFSAIAIFFLTLFGFLNVFLALDLSKKKNLGTVIKASLTTAAIVIIGALYVYAIFATDAALKLENGLKLVGVETMFDTNCIISIVTVIASAAFSIIGLILAFIFYDRTYEKVDR